MNAPDLGTVHRWLTDHGSLDGLVIEASSTIQLHDTYFDTDDWRFHRAGFALRLREDSGKAEATLKALHSTSAEMANRRELSEPVLEATADAILRLTGPVGTRVQAVAGTQPLRALFEVRTARQRFTVRAIDESEALGEVALDSTMISRPQGDPQASMQRVEVEALTGVCTPLEKLVKMLRMECALQSVADSKYTVGLKSVGLAPPAAPQFAPTVADASMRTREVALANLRRHLSAWLTHEPGARLGDDMEEVHDLRIAGRRLYAVLTLFAPYLPTSLVRTKTTLKKLLRALGSVRDLDVQLSELAKFVLKVAPSEHEAVEPLQRHLESERAEARTRMLHTLDSASTQRWLEKLTLAIARPPASRALRNRQMAVALVPKLVRARHRKLRKSVSRLTPQSSMEDYHLVRGRVKKLRYAIESVAALYGKPADDMLRALRRLQDRLGAQHDAHVSRSRLFALAADASKTIPATTVFMMGRLAERRAASAERARERFDKTYRKVRGKRWKALCSKFQDLHSPAPETVQIAVKADTPAVRSEPANP